jgi:hypothetical protein
MMFLVYIDQMVYYFGTNIYYNLKKFTIACLCINFLRLLLFWSKCKNSILGKSKKMFIVILLLQLVVLGKNATIFVLLIIFILNQVNKIKVNILLTYLICEYFWWILGNRY